MRPRDLRWLVLGLALLPAGCADDTAQVDPAPSALARRSSTVQKQPVDDGLVAFISKSRTAHHQADLAEAKGQVEQAIKFLEVVPYGTKPHPSPEVSEIVADAHARLADLKSQAGRFDDAHKDVSRGLELSPDVSYLRGHLFEVQGLVEERRMKALEQKGDTAGAERAKAAALASFEKAIEIQDQVIENALKTPPPTVPSTGQP